MSYIYFINTNFCIKSNLTLNYSVDNNKIDIKYSIDVISPSKETGKFLVKLQHKRQ